MALLDSLIEDLRFAVRQIRSAPAFTATAALTLALGIGANTAIFSIVNGYLRPLPVPDPDRIVIVASVLPGDETGLRYRFSYPALEDYRREAAVFSDVFAFDVRIGGLRGTDGKTTQFVYHSVSGNFFSALGIAPAAGRLFLPGEGEQPNAEPLVVLGYSFWQRRFGGNPHVVGEFVQLNGQSTRVIGVAPEGFRGAFEGAEMEGYAPLGVESRHSKTLTSSQYFTDRSVRFLTMMARLRPGVSLEQAQAAVDVVAKGLASQYPATEKGTGARVLAEPLARPMPLPFLTNLMPFVRMLLFGLASMVLLIACMNVANLLLVRATVRQREIAVRAALGAGRHRLVRLLLVESLLLAIVGASLGLVVARWISTAFVNSIDIGTDIPLVLDFHFDWRVFSYTLTTAVVTGLVVGVLPALRASRAEVTDLLHDGGRGGSAGAARQRVRSLLVMAQVAGSLALLVVAGLFVRNLHQAQYIDVGFDPANVLTVRLDPQQIGYESARANTFFDELDRRIRALPGVEASSMSFSVPLGYIAGGYVVRPEGESASKDGPRAAIGCNSVSPTYFETMRIPLVRGRAFTDRDIDGAPRVAIVNQTFAARVWPNQDPIGKRLEVPNIPGPSWQVVGVAHDSKYFAVFEYALPYFYLPQAQNSSFLRSFQIRSTIPLKGLAAMVQREIEALDRDMPIADLRPLRDTITGNIGFVMFRIGAMQATAMSILGLVLAIIGVYGVVSYRTTQRGREIGIRLALGAQSSDVRGLVLQQGAGLVISGIACGLLTTVVMTAMLKRFVVLVSVTDPLTFGLVTVVLAATALLACYLPARRAMRIDPVVALRQE
jgi:predicted permease